MEAFQFPHHTLAIIELVVVGYSHESGPPSAISTANPNCTPIVRVAMIVVSTALTIGTSQAFGSERRVKIAMVQ